MPIDYPAVLNLKSEGIRLSWSESEAMLYALGIGLGSDPLDQQELQFVYEKNLKVVPTFAASVMRAVQPGNIELNRSKVVDGGRRLVLHSALPRSAEALADAQVVSVYDRGPDKGAVIMRKVEMRNALTGAPMATLTSTTFALGDGGFAGPPFKPEALAETPSRPPDRTVEVATPPNLALIYRLAGDRNPIHVDPHIAASVGYSKPILHGLCTYGICCRLILRDYVDFDVGAIKLHEARFSSPFFPGEILSVDFWKDGRSICFEARSKERNKKVLANGRTEIA